ncbi:hypothetical protein LZ554_004966 [Drepanopeziza brunnea f. sp. 'monogermtubi']|nr:hypothetical protein LZ554_004966 [Drepanopeziza brunnea f. sp. 'monogermtubi']
MALPPVSTSSGIVGPMPSAGLCGAQGNGNSCQDSGYGSCCGSDDTCGHDAAHCGNGCQQEFGYCTPVSNDGTCGNGVTCTGSPFGTCCSQYGYCGNSTEFCGNGCQPELGTCDAAPTFSTVTLTNAPVPSPTPIISNDGTCGNGVTCTGSGFGTCCSQYNYCGNSPDYCEAGCQPAFGICYPALASSVVSPAPIPSPTPIISNDGTCGNGVTCTGSGFGTCCSQYNYCGNSPDYCEAGCQPAFGICYPAQASSVVSPAPISSATPLISTDGSCGNGVTCTGSGFGTCCSQYNYCGNSPDYCEAGCQTEFGICGADPASSITQTVAPSSIAVDLAASTIVPASSIAVDPAASTIVPASSIVVDPAASTIVPASSIAVDPAASTIVPASSIAVDPAASTIVPASSIAVDPAASTIVPASSIAVDPAASTIVPASSIVVDPAASTTMLPSQVTDTSSSIMPSATTQFACAGDTGSYAPGSTPAAIGAAVLASIPGLSIDGPDTSRYQLGLLDDTIGTVIQAEINPNPLYTDEFAYYEVDETIFPPTTPLGSCFNFGYFYHVNAGLCATVSGVTSYASPLFNNAQLTLQPCLCTSSGRPPIEQLFCNIFDDVPGGPGLNCLVFAGDEGDESVYGLNYGNPPFVGTLAFNDGVCISIEFDADGSLPNAGSSTIIGVPATSTQSALSAISSAAYVQFPTAIALSSVFNPATSSPADFPTPITQILAPTGTLASVLPNDNVFTYYVIQTNSSSADGLATLYAADLAAPSDQVIAIAALATPNAADLATLSDQVIVPTILSSIAALATPNAADLATPSDQVIVPTILSSIAALATPNAADLATLSDQVIVPTILSSIAALATSNAADLATLSDQVIVPTILSSIAALATPNAADLATPSDQVIVPTILSPIAALATSNAADLATPSDQVIIPTIVDSIAALATPNAADLATPSDQVIVPTILSPIAALATSNAADLATPSNQVVVPASTLALPREQQSASLAL